MPRQKKQKLIGLGLPANLMKEFIQLSYKGNNSIAPEGWNIDTPLSDSRVKVYTKPNSKEVIIVHRGSVGAQDWLDNMSYVVRGKVKGTKSFNLHKERQLKAVEKYGGENIIGLGHSRAGLYLQELQKDPATKLKEIITYNKAVGFYDALRTNPDEQTDVKVKNDFVSLLSGLQKRKNKMVEIEATKNPLDFNKAHQPAEIEKLGDTFIGKKEELNDAEKPMIGSGRSPSPKTLEELNKMLKTLEKQLININKGKVYKTTNKEKVEYNISYTKARIKNHETKGEDLIITKKAKYGNELPAKAKPYKAKPKQKEPKKEEPKKEEPKKEEPKKEEIWEKERRENKIDKSLKTLEYYKEIYDKMDETKQPRTRDEFTAVMIEEEKMKNEKKEEPKKEEPKKEEPKKEEPKKEEPKPKKEKPIKLDERIKTIKKECSKSTTIDKNNLICVLNQDALDGVLLFTKKQYKPSTSTEDLIEIINDDLKQDFGISYVMEIDSKYGRGAHKHNKIYERFFAGDKAIIDDFNYFIYKTYRSINKDIRPLKENPNPLQLEPAPKASKAPKAPKKEEPKPKPPKLERQNPFMLGYKEPKKEVKEVKKEIDLNKMTKAELITYYEKIRPSYLTTSNKAMTKKQLILAIQIREADIEKERKEGTYTETETKPAIKTKAELLQELENIILNKDADEINELLRAMGYGGAILTSQEARQRTFQALKLKSATKSKKQRPFNIEDFVIRFNKENCEDLMCKYGINSKAEFKKWVVKNHPDKGGTIDDDDFKQIIKCAIKEKYCSKKTGGIFGFSAEEKEARKKEKAEKRAKFDAQKKARAEKTKEFIEALNLIKKKKQAKKEAETKAEPEPEAEPEAEAEPIEGGIFGWSTKEKADKAERKMLREEYYKTHNRQQNANYTFDKTARKNWKKEFYKKNTFKKADETMPKAVETMTGAVDTNEQQGIDEAEQEMLGSGMYYLKEISKPTNPIFKYKRTAEIPTFIDPETEFLMGGAFTDMLGMNCNKEDGSCFNPTWERRKIRSQILSEYKIWYNPFAPPPAGTIRMAWLNPMIEQRFKPIYDEFVARRNVNVGLPADASRDRFAQQMFSNITDGLSYIPGSNLATAGLTLASTLSDTKKEDGT